MADTIWDNSDSDNDLDNDNNWSNGKPVADDNVFFSSTQTASATVNGDNAIAVDMPDLIHVGPGYSGQIGTAAEPWHLSTDKLVHEGSGTLYWKDGAGPTLWVYIDSGASGLAASLGGDTMTRCSLIRGRVDLTSTLGTVAELAINPAATVDIQGGTMTRVMMSGGTVTNIGTITTLIMGGGSWINHAAAPAITTMYVGGSSTLVYNNRTTITTAWVGSGATLDLSRDSRPLTITNGYFAPGSKVLGGNNLTVTNYGTLRPWSVID